MKKTKPMDPREADKISRRIMDENKLDMELNKLRNSTYFAELPKLSQFCLGIFVQGYDFDDTFMICEAFDNLPTYELAEFDRRYGWMRRLAQKLQGCPSCGTESRGLCHHCQEYVR